MVIEIGRLCVKTAGRDAGKKAVVIDLINDAYALIDGIIAAAIGLSIQSGLLFVEGVIGVIVGAIIFMFTPQAVVLFLFLVGAWAILTGILEIIAAFELGKYIKHEIYLLIVGLSSIILGILVYINPLVAGYAITIVIGIYALIFGSFLTVMAFKLKDYRPKTAKRRR